MQDVCRYWASDYNWRRCEAAVNTYDQFKTTIDGLGIHFLHDTDSLALRLLMALLPVAALGGVLRAHLRYVATLDELQRWIEHRALLVATGVVAMTSVAAGFLQVWGLLPRGGLLLVWAELYLVWMIARAWIARGYRG